MDKRASLVLALVITGMFPAMTLNAWLNRPAEYTEQGAIDAALFYLKTSPTFKHDGILESINVTGAYRARTPIPTWLVVVEFDCANSGYGDRTGQIVLEVETHHEIGVIVEEGVVIQAAIDGEWDEMAQEPLERGDPDSDSAEEIALEFLRNGATFKFVGIEATIEVEEIRILESYPVQYIVIISFDSSHAGYGDRTGQILAQVITPHSAWVKVVNGEVVSAVLDNTWDELNQKEKQSELIPIEQARDLVIQYILEKYDITVPVPEAWTFAILTPEDLVGASTQQFVGGGWEMNISFPAVITPIYALSVSYTGETNFTWEGTVNQLCNVMDTSTSLKPEILMPEDARDIAVEYVIKNIEAMKGVEIPSRWIAEETTPSGFFGFSSRRYMCEGWTVNVSSPVVWKPTYQVEIEYTGEFTFSWEGTVDQSGSVEEK
ncbi:hypothetical protein E3J39_00440 [Candidatus Bathyarchaeota archaeon]|nr:MAG: hypothetical protein E3J39_00440 [Candidatus Bathyarchaeota archaeon]